MPPVGVNLRVEGSYSSALERSLPSFPTPPAMRTVPLYSSVAECFARVEVMVPTRTSWPPCGAFSGAAQSRKNNRKKPAMPANRPLPVGGFLKSISKRRFLPSAHFVSELRSADQELKVLPGVPQSNSLLKTPERVEVPILTITRCKNVLIVLGLTFI